MLIYAVADIHADPERIKKIRHIVSSRQPDVLVVAGDAVSYIRPGPVFERFNSMGVPVLMVRGNSDPGYVEKYLKKFINVQSLHLNTVTIKKIPFTGLSGTIPLPFRNRVRFFEKDLAEKAQRLIDSKTVFVAHPPPRGSLDRVMNRFHSGSKMVRALVEEKQPRLLICGHIHEAAGIETIGQTTVVNCGMPKTGKGMMIELEQKDKPVIELV